MLDEKMHYKMLRKPVFLFLLISTTIATGCSQRDERPRETVLDYYNDLTYKSSEMVEHGMYAESCSFSCDNLIKSGDLIHYKEKYSISQCDWMKLSIELNRYVHGPSVSIYKLNDDRENMWIEWNLIPKENVLALKIIKKFGL